MKKLLVIANLVAVAYFSVATFRVMNLAGTGTRAQAYFEQSTVGNKIDFNHYYWTVTATTPLTYVNFSKWKQSPTGVIVGNGTVHYRIPFGVTPQIQITTKGAAPRYRTDISGGSKTDYFFAKVNLQADPDMQSVLEYAQTFLRPTRMVGDMISFGVLAYRLPLFLTALGLVNGIALLFARRRRYHQKRLEQIMTVGLKLTGKELLEFEALVWNSKVATESDLAVAERIRQIRIGLKELSEHQISLGIFRASLERLRFWHLHQEITTHLDHIREREWLQKAAEEAHCKKVIEHEQALCDSAAKIDELRKRLQVFNGMAAATDRSGSDYRRAKKAIEEAATDLKRQKPNSKALHFVEERLAILEESVKGQQR